MTALHRCCPYCATGLLRDDPQTGDTGCDSCGVRTGTIVGLTPPTLREPPPVLGGQGRDAEDIRDDAAFVVAAVVAILVMVTAFVVIGWVGAVSR